MHDFSSAMMEYRCVIVFIPVRQKMFIVSTLPVVFMVKKFLKWLNHKVAYLEFQAKAYFYLYFGIFFIKILKLSTVDL